MSANVFGLRAIACSSLLFVVVALQLPPREALAARTILSEDFEDEAPGSRPAGTFYARSLVPFVNAQTEPAKVVVTGGEFPDPIGAGNQSLVFHNPNSAAQMGVTWTSIFDDNPAAFRNGVIEFDLWMEKPLPNPGKFWSFMDVRIGYGDATRSGVSTVGDVTIWNNIRIQNVAGQSDPVESIVDAGAQFSVGLQTTYTDPNPGLMAPDSLFHVRFEINGTPGGESYVLKVSNSGITWLQDGATSHPWVPGAPGINVLSFLTDASSFFGGGASNVYLDNLVVVNNDLSPLGNGDYNGDSVVDGADFLLWQRTFGTIVPAGSGADGNGNGTVDDPDLTIWQGHFGTVVAAPSAASIPEPTTFVLLSGAVVFAAAALRRQRLQTV